MTNRCLIIVPELPPAIGGVSDYTAALVQHWPSPPQLRFLVAHRDEGDPSEFLGFSVEKIARDSNALSKQLTAQERSVLLQYSAYGFDPRGFPRQLIRALLRWKRTTGGRLVIMFHELWTVWPIFHPHFLTQRAHRRAIGRLLRVCDTAFTTTVDQVMRLRELAPQTPMQLLPAGSNIPVVGPLDLERQRGLAVLFGLQASRLRTLREMQSALQQLARVSRITEIISIGGSQTGAGEEEEKESLGALNLRRGYILKGALPAAEISSLLARAEFGLSAQSSLGLTKSGTLMACAAHALNILSPAANAAATEPANLLTAPGELLAGLDEEKLRERARHLHDWFLRTASWPRIASQFAQALQPVTPPLL